MSETATVQAMVSTDAPPADLPAGLRAKLNGELQGRTVIAWSQFDLDENNRFTQRYAVLTDQKLHVFGDGQNVAFPIAQIQEAKTVEGLGVDRLTRAIWPEAGPQVGLAAVALFLAAKAGNIGTNHLFEAMVLDRLMAFALGWLALAEVIVHPSRGHWHAMVAIALATVIHPSVGLQLALMLAASMDATSAATIVTTTAPRARSIRRIPTPFMRDWMKCPRDEPP